MRNLFIVCAFMFSALTFAQMSFSLSNEVDITTPMATTEANLGWFMNDDILVSFGMTDWDNFNVGARYYTGFCGNMFIEANTNAEPSMSVEVDADGLESMVADGGSDYAIGAAIGWTKSLGIWKLQFEPSIRLADIQDFTPHLAWGLRFNL